MSSQRPVDGADEPNEQVSVLTFCVVYVHVILYFNDKHIKIICN